MNKIYAAVLSVLALFAVTACTADTPEPQPTVTVTAEAESVEKTMPPEPAETEEPKPENTTIVEGKDGTVEQQDAYGAAVTYLRMMPFSKQGLIDQLVFEGHARADAEWAITNVDTDWDQHAIDNAKSYVDIFPEMTFNNLVEQMTTVDKYTEEQAAMAAEAAGL